MMFVPSTFTLLYLNLSRPFQKERVSNAMPENTNAFCSNFLFQRDENFNVMGLFSSLGFSTVFTQLRQNCMF